MKEEVGGQKRQRLRAPFFFFHLRNRQVSLDGLGEVNLGRMFSLIKISAHRFLSLENLSLSSQRECLGIYGHLGLGQAQSNPIKP